MGGEKEEHRCSEKRGKACIDEKKVVPLCDFAIMEQGARTMDNGQWTMDKRLITFVCHTVEYISIFVLGFFSEAGFVLGFFSETVLVPFSTQCGAWFIR